jgi:tRNA dimethylallyltransferase
MLAGQATLSHTIELVQTRTRQLAKRQVTWFRHLEEVRSINVSPDEGPEAVADRLALSIMELV